MIDMKSWLTGFILGLCGKPLPFTRKTPIGYSYNGVVFPDIDTVWTDKETFKCAMISYNQYTSEYYLLLSDLMDWKDESTLNLHNHYYYYVVKDGSWKPNVLYNSSYIWSTSQVSEYRWTNFDLANYSGEGMYFSASDPIPVYECGEPVAYLYNGVHLPPLPEWDREKYPYAYIIFSRLAGAYRIYTSNKAGVYDQNNLRFIFSQNKDVEGLQYNHYVDRQWVYVGTHDYNELSTVSNEPVWANTDILNSDGSVYLSASDPIPVYECGEPVAYLYNGVHLPPLPEWDRETYPYAVIICAASPYKGEYMLFVSDAVVNVTKVFGGDSPHTDGSCLCYRIENSEFVHYSALDDTLISGSEIVWANHDIHRGPQDEEPGKLVLSASEPIPVYE